MLNNINSINDNIDSINNYDYLDFSYDKMSGLRYGVNLGGNKGITFEPDKNKFRQLNEEFKSNNKLLSHKIINDSPLKIIINKKNMRKFRFTTCLDMIECLEGIGETRTLIYNALRLSNEFVFITQPNYDSDVNLFKQGFKTHFSDWSRHTNHLTSNIFFNLLFDFYKQGFIEDFVIFYSDPITDSQDPIIHPLNSPKNQPSFDEDLHPTKKDNVKFKNVYRTLNLIITINGFKKIDVIYEKIEGEKTVVYDSRQGIYDNSVEIFTEVDNEDKKGIIGKVNEFLNTDI